MKKLLFILILSLPFVGQSQTLQKIIKNGEEVTVTGGGGSSYNAPIVNSLNGSSDFTVTDANIHSGAAEVHNQLDAAETIQITLDNINSSEVDVFRFDLTNGGGRLDFLSANDFVAFGATTGQSVRLDGIGSVDFVETGPNTNVFKVYAGTNVAYITIDTNAPLVSSAVIENADPDALIVSFNEEVISTTNTGLSMDGDFSDVTLTPSSGSGTTQVTYSMSRPAVGGETGNFVYGATNEIEDLNGNGLVSGSTAVTNNVSSAYSPNNLYTEASALNADNQNLTVGTWIWENAGGGTATGVVDAGGSAGGGANAVRLQATGPVGGNFLQFRLPLTGALATTSAGDYDIKFDIKVVAMPATQNEIQLEITGAGSGGFTGVTYGAIGASTYTSFSHTFTSDGTQENVRLYIGTAGQDPTGSYDVYIKNFEFVPTGQ